MITYRYIWGPTKQPINKKHSNAPINLDDDGDYEGLQATVRNSAMKKGGIADMTLQIHAVASIAESTEGFGEAQGDGDDSPPQTTSNSSLNMLIIYRVLLQDTMKLAL